MDCRSCEKYINQYLDGELSKRKEKRFQKHLTKCEACKTEFDQYMFMNDQLAGVEELSISGGFEARILSRLQPYEAHIVEEETSQRDQVKDLILIFAYFLTLFVVLNVLRNAVFLNVDWISGIMVTGRVFREVFDGMIVSGIFSLFVVYPLRIFHWTRVNLSQMSLEGRMVYFLVIMNLLLIITFSQIMLKKLAKGRGKENEGKAS